MTPEQDHRVRQEIGEAALFGSPDGRDAEHIVARLGDLTTAQYASYYRMIAATRRHREQAARGDRKP